MTNLMTVAEVMAKASLVAMAELVNRQVTARVLIILVGLLVALLAVAIIKRKRERRNKANFEKAFAPYRTRFNLD